MKGKILILSFILIGFLSNLYTNKKNIFICIRVKQISCVMMLKAIDY